MTVACSQLHVGETDDFELRTFPNDGAYTGIVMVRDISFEALCTEHRLPFTGLAHVAYVPGDRIVGLSKLARLVDHVADLHPTHGPLASRIAEMLSRAVASRGTGVVVAVDRSCASPHDLRSPDARSVTTALTGCLRDDPAMRSEFLTLAATPSR